MQSTSENQIFLCEGRLNDPQIRLPLTDEEVAIGTVRISVEAIKRAVLPVFID